VRIVKIAYIPSHEEYDVRHFYYNDRWQCVEERLESGGVISANNLRQYAWGGRYVDDLLYRRVARRRIRPDVSRRGGTDERG